MRVGDAVELFDGRGRVWQANVSQAAPDACVIERGSLIGEEEPPAPELRLAQAVLKSGAMDRLLRQATELGANQFWPLTTARTQVNRARASARSGHWRQIVVSACEQSQRAHLPRLNETMPVEEFFDTVDPPEALLLHPNARPLQRQLPVRPTTVLVGPEGGWTDDELAQARHRGIEPFSLGRGILRAETAPLAAISAIRHAWGWHIG